MAGLVSIIRVIAAILLGAGLAYFWKMLNPADSFETILGVGIIGTIASFVVLYFMGKSQG